MPKSNYTDDLAPSYALVAREIHQMLSTMKVDDRLISERRLSEKLGVSRVTLRRSLDYFQRQGILRTRPGGGSFLAQPVESLKSPKQSKSRIVGLLVETVENTMIARIVRGFEQKACELGYHLALAHDYGDMDHQLAQLRRMKEGDIAGVAIFPDTHHAVDRPEFIAALRELTAERTKLVLIDRYAPGLDVPCVLSDNVRGSYLATEHLILTGHRRLGLLSFGGNSSTTRDRRKGFLDALEQYDIQPEPVVEAKLGHHDYELLAKEAVSSWIPKGKKRLPFDGLVCMQDNMAYGAFLALKEAGISVPHQVGLIGYDNLNREMYKAVGLDLSSVDQPAEQIGSEVAQRLISQVEGQGADISMHILLKPNLIVRSSCG